MPGKFLRRASHPPTKIYKGDELQSDLLELILHNCRMPNWNRSDFNALVAAIRTAESA